VLAWLIAETMSVTALQTSIKMRESAALFALTGHPNPTDRHNPGGPGLKCVVGRQSLLQGFLTNLSRRIEWQRLDLNHAARNFVVSNIFPGPSEQ